MAPRTTILIVSEDAGLPEKSGWYPDPYGSDLQRWFDGSKWTTHAVEEWETDPDRAVDRNWAMDSPEQLRRQEWETQFPPKGTISFGTRLPHYDRKSGLYVNDIGSRHPWAEAILSLCCVVGFGAFTIMAAIQAGTAQYGAVWAVFAGVVLIPSTIAAVHTIRVWPRHQRISPGFGTSSRQR